MQLGKKIRLVEHLDHAGHVVALWLVAASATAELLRSLVPAVEQVQPILAAVLHWVHLVALFVAISYLLARALLKRSVGREIAEAVERDDREQRRRSQRESPLVSERSHSYGYERLSIAPGDVVFVTSANDPPAVTLFEMNEAAFEDSAFEIDSSTIRRRNTEWISKNPKIFMLVRLPIGLPRLEGEGLTSRHFFGYTAIAPLNTIGADVYLRGLIKDKDLPASLIAGSGEDSPALLIFAVARHAKYRHDKSLAAPYLELLLRAVEYHVAEIASAHRGQVSEMKVWTQSEHPSIRGHLRKRGFRSTTPPTMSAEGFELICLPLDIPNSPAPSVGK